MNFAKLFQISETVQVLFTCEYDTTEEVHQVVIRTDFNGTISLMKIGLESEEDVLEFINKAEVAHAIQFRKLLKGFLTQEKAKLN